MTNKNYNNEKNNRIRISGTITTKPILESTFLGVKYYSMMVHCKRRSENADSIPAIISERMLEFPENLEDMVGKHIKVFGYINSMSRRKDAETKSHLRTSVMANRVFIIEDNEEHENSVLLRGFITQAPIYRQTPLGREIADVFLAVNRGEYKSDYIPCICWGKDAVFAGTLPVGSEVIIRGRLQHRTYLKKYEDGTSEEKVTYEVSVGSISLIRDKNPSKAEENNNENMSENFEK